jgi:glycosyltransferase involved in cell wall biosynthesis
MTLITVAIPFLNEAENVASLVNELNNFFADKKDYSAEVIFVDDGSTDDSVEFFKNSKHIHYKAKIISLSKNYGSHAALRAAIANATGDYITFMYADMQDPISLINELWTKCASGYDVSWATRKNVDNKLSERMFSTMYASLMRRFVHPLYPSNGFDVVMFSKKVQLNLNNHQEANSSVFLQILTMGFKQSFIFYNKKARVAGKSKWTLAKKIKLFIDSFVAFSYVPIRFVSFIGLLFFITGLGWTVFIILKKIFVGDVTPGWAALSSVLFMGFGLTNISLGIIAEYTWRSLDASRKRPVYIIDKIIALGNE